ncbi:MAG: RidA family protein [Pseudomonadota bacterium]
MDVQPGGDGQPDGNVRADGNGQFVEARPPRQRALRPETIAAPFARYVHGVALPASAELVLTSGQLGLAPDGSLAPDAEGQTRQCFTNILAILAEAGLDARHILRVNAFVTDRAHMAGYMAARDAAFAGIDPPPASTLMIVAGFTRPDFLVEVEAIAAG